MPGDVLLSIRRWWLRSWQFPGKQALHAANKRSFSFYGWLSFVSPHLYDCFRQRADCQCNPVHRRRQGGCVPCHRFVTASALFDRLEQARLVINPFGIAVSRVSRTNVEVSPERSGRLACAVLGSSSICSSSGSGLELIWRQPVARDLYCCVLERS